MIKLGTILRKCLLTGILFSTALTIKAELKTGTEYYIWLNIYEKLLGTNEAGSGPALSAFGKNTDADSYVFKAEASGKSGYVLLRQKSSGKYLAASSSNSYSVLLEGSKSTDDRYCWKVDEGTYTYLINKKSGKYLGVDGANKGSDYVSVYYDKPKGSHSQYSAIPAVGTWDESRQAYESALYKNAQDINEIDYCQLNNKTLDRSDTVDIHITANDNPILGSSSINLGSEYTWLIFDNIVPSNVISSYLKYVKIKGAKAVNNKNCRVAIYLNGAAVIPLPSTPMTCNGTAGEFTLAVGNHKDLGNQSNTMTSFVLRRGYMATLATGTNGSGYSRVFVADHADLEITLPNALTRRVTSVNLKNWQYLSKKGWGNTSGTSGADKLRATWYWSWSAGYSSTNDLEYVPCRQHLYWPSASDVNNKTATAALSLNEPEHSEQHTSDKCSCGGTINAWKAYTINNDFLPGGGRIGSPQPTELSYLTEFFGHVDDMSSRCDFAITHAYWDLASYNETEYANWFCNTQCKSVWNNTKRPLWLTEMEISSSWNGTKVTSYDQNRKYLQVLLQKIEECPWIERYAIYGTDMWQTAMFYEYNPSKGLTPAGQVYRDHRSTFAYNASYTKTPVWWKPGIKTPTLDCKISASAGTATFTLGNANGDYTEQMELQQFVDGTWQTLQTFTDRAQFEQSTLTCTLPLADIASEGGRYRLTATTIFGETAQSSELQPGYIANPTIITNSKTDVPGWTCIRNAENGYTKAESGDTYLEVWNPTAAPVDFDYYQDISDIPNGVYKLSAVCFNYSGGAADQTVNGSVGLYAVADGVGYFSPVTIDSEINYDRLTTIEQIVVRGGVLRIGIRNLGTMGARWAGADNFSLTYLGTEEEVLAQDYKTFVQSATQSIINQFPALAEGSYDATPLIRNSNCNRGTSTFWTTSNLSFNSGQAPDGDSNRKYFDVWKSGSLNSSMQQTITYLPAGTYTLSTLVRGTKDLPLLLKAQKISANGTKTDYEGTVTGKGDQTASGSPYLNGWQKVQTEEITIETGDQLTVSAQATANTTAWWSVTQFQLTYTPAPPPVTVADIVSLIRQYLNDEKISIKDITTKIQLYLTQ